MIRSLLYLDEQKLFSLSSQIMEGVSQYLLTAKSVESEEATSQAGPFASGRALADVIKSSTTSVERRVLHDHAFAAFEEKLVSSGLITDVHDVQDTLLDNRSFVRVTAPATFIDPGKITHLLDTFNQLGEALAYVTNKDAIEAARVSLESVKASTKDKSRIAQLERQLKDQIDASALAKAAGMHQDPSFLKYLRQLLEYGYADQLELQQVANKVLYSTPLKRESLREPESLLIKKYSRKTEKNLVVLGFPTQTEGSAPASSETHAPDPNHMKEAVANLIAKFAAVEASLFGKSVHEVVIDPIAVYVSL
jgi:hypothetical protein